MNPLCGKHPVVAVVPSRMIWTEDRQVMHQINAAQKITGNLHHHNNYTIIIILYIYNTGPDRIMEKKTFQFTGAACL